MLTDVTIERRSAEPDIHILYAAWERYQTVDVILSPTGSDGRLWTLKDPLGRSLGTVRRGTNFEIVVESTGRLNGISHHYKTLDALMTAIANHMKGSCSLGSQD
ncbi:hypothetical protein GCM10007884_35450 [Methylobacterium brachythecii]|uniref:Uncharacterized protein n=1 Tax=Methylobacterium brachythecii TaxID=1176177 RepID=A0ABQ6D5C3_9HYPH|nr:hypothetical protein GCM10007884_35450 [Methylobacterium brachythecii]